MWEDMDSRKKSKGQKLFSQGVVVLVCLILTGQTVFFGKYLIDSRRSDRSGLRTMQETPQANAQDNARDNDAPAPESPSAQAPPSGSGGQTASGGRSDRSGSTPPDRTRPPASTAADSRAPYPSGTPDVRNNSIQTDSPSAAYPHDGWHWDRVELNSADSAALDALPGIGPYYARQILAYRDRLGFYADLTQLLDIRGMDSARLHRLADRLYIDPASIRPLDLYTMSLDSMAAQKRISPSRPSSTAASSLPPRPAASRSTSGWQAIQALRNRNKRTVCRTVRLAHLNQSHLIHRYLPNSSGKLI